MHFTRRRLWTAAIVLDAERNGPQNGASVACNLHSSAPIFARRVPLICRLVSLRRNGRALNRLCCPWGRATSLVVTAAASPVLGTSGGDRWPRSQRPASSPIHDCPPVVLPFNLPPKMSSIASGLKLTLAATPAMAGRLLRFSWWREKVAPPKSRGTPTFPKAAACLQSSRESFAFFSLACTLSTGQRGRHVEASHLTSTVILIPILSNPQQSMALFK